MAVKHLSVEEFVAFMKRQQGEQTDKEFAEHIGVTPQYICDIYNGRRIPGKSITEALGVTRQTVYTVFKEDKK